MIINEAQIALDEAIRKNVDRVFFMLADEMYAAQSDDSEKERAVLRFKKRLEVAGCAAREAKLAIVQVYKPIKNAHKT